MKMKKVALLFLLCVIHSMTAFSEEFGKSNHDKVVKELCKGTEIILVEQVDTVGAFRAEILEELIKDSLNTTVIDIKINALGEFMLDYEYSNKEEVVSLLTRYNKFHKKNLIIYFGYDDGIYGHETPTPITPIHLVKEIGKAIIDLYERRRIFLAEQEPMISPNELCKEKPFIIINDYITWRWILLPPPPPHFNKDGTYSYSWKKMSIGEYQKICQRNLKLYKCILGPTEEMIEDEKEE